MKLRYSSLRFHPVYYQVVGWSLAASGKCKDRNEASQALQREFCSQESPDD